MGVDLITIIVPVYNVEKYIRECNRLTYLIKHIKTWKSSSWMMASKDKSGEICENYANADSRVKVIHKENEGLGFARNTGLTVAAGSMFCYFYRIRYDVADADLVERLLKGITDSKCDTCLGGFKRISENGTTSFVEQYDIALFTGAEVYNELFARMLGSAPDKHDAIRMSVWNVMYSMDIIRKYKIKFPSERKFISEDIIWDSEYYKYAKQVKVIDSTAYNYRITPGSFNSEIQTRYAKKICVLYNEMTDRLSNDEAKITRLQRQFFVNLRACLKQENPKVSKKCNPEVVNSIKEIVNNETVHTVATAYEKLLNNIGKSFL